MPFGSTEQRSQSLKNLNEPGPATYTNQTKMAFRDQGSLEKKVPVGFGTSLKNGRLSTTDNTARDAEKIQGPGAYWLEDVSKAASGLDAIQVSSKDRSELKTKSSSVFKSNCTRDKTVYSHLNPGVRLIGDDAPK